MTPGASQRWELYAPFDVRTGAWLNYDVMAGDRKVGTDRITIAYEFNYGAGMYSGCRETSSETRCHADGRTRLTNEVTFADPPGLCRFVHQRLPSNSSLNGHTVYFYAYLPENNHPTRDNYMRCAHHNFGNDYRQTFSLEAPAVDLSYADLHGAYNFGDVLTNPAAHLYRANLSGANLENALADSTDFGHADLRNANLRSAYLYEAKLRGADLRYADLSPVPTHQTRTNLQGDDLTGADLRHANLNDVRLNKANLTDVHLDGAILRGADLSRVVFCHTTMPNGTERNDGCPKPSRRPK